MNLIDWLKSKREFIFIGYELANRVVPLGIHYIINIQAEHLNPKKALVTQATTYIKYKNHDASPSHKQVLYWHNSAFMELQELTLNVELSRFD